MPLFFLPYRCMKIKIQSVTDIITNSSSEAFLVKTDIKPKDIESLEWMYSMQQGDKMSGEGGLVLAYDRTTDKKYDDIETPYVYLPEGFIAVLIDYNRKATIKRLIEEFEVVDTESWFYKKDPNGRITELIIRPEWEKLPNNEKVNPGSVFNKFLSNYFIKEQARIDKRFKDCKTDKECEGIWEDYEKLQNIKSYYGFED